jgi:hypothetical protein
MAGLCVASMAFALESGVITSIEIISTGTPANDMVLVFGNFTPATGCTYNAFVLVASDSYFNQTFAALLSAKAAGTPIQYEHVFCTPSGYSRGDLYIVN